jgi:hypothetical protein
MIHIYRKSEFAELKNGISFWPLSDEASFGFKIRYGKRIQGTNLGSKLLTVRYSKKTKYWFIQRHSVPVDYTPPHWG